MLNGELSSTIFFLRVFVNSSMDVKISLRGYKKIQAKEKSIDSGRICL